MSNLNNQLNAITDKAIMVIASQLDKNSNLINFVSPDDFDLSEHDGDDFYRLVADKTLMITHNWEVEGNEDVYLLSIKGTDHQATIVATNLWADKREISLFELDAHNLTLLADYLLNK